jgi:hypothetical protein
MLRASSRSVGVPCNESQRRTALVSAAAGSQVERFRQGHGGSGSGACGKEPCRRLGRGSVLGALRKLPQVRRVRTQYGRLQEGQAERLLLLSLPSVLDGRRVREPQEPPGRGTGVRGGLDVRDGREHGDPAGTLRSRCGGAVRRPVAAGWCRAACSPCRQACGAWYEDPDAVQPGQLLTLASSPEQVRAAYARFGACFTVDAAGELTMRLELPLEGGALHLTTRRSRTFQVQRICQHTCEVQLSAAVGQDPDLGSP